MKDIVLYCKSYHRDVLRAARLAESVRRHNPGNLPFYLSCPSTDLPLFKDIVGSDGVTLLADEEIVAANVSLDKKAFSALPGVISQQIVKSEFWRLGICEIISALIPIPISFATATKVIFLPHQEFPLR